jgi:nucleotide-binding universal stress UspA family protein
MMAPDSPGVAAAPRFRHVLVPVDLTPASDRVVGRLAFLPLAEDARVTLVHVVPDSLSVRDQRTAARGAKKALAEETEHLRDSMAVRIDALVRVGVANQQISACAKTVRADLIVMGRGSGRVLRDAFLGSTAERVIRKAKLPVLVVRLRPRAAYRRPAIALDFDQAAPRVLGAALRILEPPRPRVTIIHAYDYPYRSWVYPTLPEKDREREVDHRADVSEKLAKLLNTSLARASDRTSGLPISRKHLRYGSPRLTIEGAVRRAASDLLVLGTRGHSSVVHVLLGTVAGDVLRSVGCDVLVVPPVPKR